MKSKLKAGDTSDENDADADCDNVEDCSTGATANRYVFDHVRSQNLKLKHPAKNRRMISNKKLGFDQTYSTANNDDNFNSDGNEFDDIVDSKQTATPTTATTQLDIHFLWIFLKDLLTSLVNNNDYNETNENTNDINFELNTQCDYLDDSNYLTIVDDDGDLNDDDNSQKHKLLEPKLLGNFSLWIFLPAKKNKKSQPIKFAPPSPKLCHKRSRTNTENQTETFWSHLYPFDEISLIKTSFKIDQKKITPIFSQTPLKRSFVR